MKILGYFRAGNSSQVFAQIHLRRANELTVLVSDRACQPTASFPTAMQANRASMTRRVTPHCTHHALHRLWVSAPLRCDLHLQTPRCHGSSVSSQSDSIHMRTCGRLISPKLMPSLTRVVIRDGAARWTRHDHERNVGRICVAQFRRRDWNDVVCRADGWVGAHRYHLLFRT